MDAFKGSEMARMELGGNEAWRNFWAEKGKGKQWEDLTIEDRYGGEAGEEWKERLRCKAEGEEFVKIPPKKGLARNKQVDVVGISGESSRASSPARNLREAGSRKEQNEAYFARLGDANANRPEDLPPYQGGKYGGFGNDSSLGTHAAGPRRDESAGLPGVDEFQKDPMAALTKGFGWFTTTVGKGAKSVNDGFIQPTAQKIAAADIPTQARITAASVAQNITTGTKGAAEQFNKFIDESSRGSLGSRPRGGTDKTMEPERRDFWDTFGAGEENRSGGRGGKGSAIGTAAMRKGGSSKDESWDEW